MGHPILGDILYSPNMGKNKFGLSGQCLHAKKIGIEHPKTHEYMEFESNLPEYFEMTLEKLRKENN
jgi:23S rRNA pseudouridine1911/1915/1917 synthase